MIFKNSKGNDSDRVESLKFFAWYFYTFAKIFSDFSNQGIKEATSSVRLISLSFFNRLGFSLKFEAVIFPLKA